MFYLLAASLLWAFSFGLIKSRLAGLDPVLVALIRLGLAGLAFAPFLRRRQVRGADAGRAMALGGLQFGLMYVLYIASFSYLPAWLVAFFTVLTPLYVVLLSGLRERGLPLRSLGAVILAVAGAAVVAGRGLPPGARWQGVLLLQGANLAFAAGQVFFPDLRRKTGAPEGSLMAWMYLGGFLVPAAVLVLGGGIRGGWPRPDQLPVLFYLGLVPTALGFYLWNKGAGRVGSGFLAGANNLKVPMAVLVSWLVFKEEADHLRVVAGLVLVVAALFLAGPGRSSDLGNGAS